MSTCYTNCLGAKACFRSYIQVLVTYLLLGRSETKAITKL